MNEIIDSFEELGSLIASDYNANRPKSLYNRQGTITHLLGFFGHIKRSKSSPVRSPATLSHAGLRERSPQRSPKSLPRSVG